MCIVTILVGRIIGFTCFVIPMFPSKPFPFEQRNLCTDVRHHSGLYHSFHWRSIASPSCVWCQHLFALSQAPRTGKFKSSGEKAADFSSSCIPTKTGQAYPCGGLHKVLFAVRQTYFRISGTCFGTVSRFFLFCCLVRPGNALQDLFQRQFWNVHATSSWASRPEASARRTNLKLRTPKRMYGTPLLV